MSLRGSIKGVLGESSLFRESSGQGVLGEWMSLFIITMKVKTKTRILKIVYALLIIISSHTSSGIIITFCYILATFSCILSERGVNESSANRLAKKINKSRDESS